MFEVAVNEARLIMQFIMCQFSRSWGMWYQRAGYRIGIPWLSSLLVDPDVSSLPVHQNYDAYLVRDYQNCSVLHTTVIHSDTCTHMW